MLTKLKNEVFKANQELVKNGLVIYSWGNASAIDRKEGLIVIKPSGVPYVQMKADDMVVVDFKGKIVEGKYKPSSDTQTHLVLYKNLPEISGIVHTHSSWATIWAQSGLSIPALGTTHADNFYGDIPCTRKLTAKEVNSDYETETGKVIIETIKKLNKMALVCNECPAILVNSHGPFTWGKSAANAVENAVVLENIAKMAYFTLSLNKVKAIDKYLLDKHYLRKHGKNAYYGQK